MESSYNPLYCSSTMRQQSVMQHTLFLHVFIFYMSTIKCCVHVCRNVLLILKMFHISYVKCKLSQKTNDINRLVRRAAVLPLLLMQNIEDIWLHTLEDIDNANTNINTVSFTEQWVENNRDLWNHHKTEGPRTTNHLEGWHHKLKNQVKHPLLNIYNLIKLNPSQQSTTEIRLIQYATGRKNPEKEKVLCTDRQQTSYTERTPDQ